MLREQIYGWLRENAKDERKATDTDDQFFYKTRKKALGPFKKDFWDLSADVKAKLARIYDEKFEFLFRQLAVNDTAKHVAKYVKTPEQHRHAPHEGMAAVVAAPDDAELSD